MESNHHSTAHSIVLPTLLAFSSAIAEDLLIEILKRLPTKTLCRFLCVCKSWKTLISSPLFVQTYNSFTSSAAAATPPNLKPYLQAYDRNDSYYLCYPQQFPSTIHLEREIHFPFAAKYDAIDDNFTFVDAIHGVVCISYSSDSSFDSTILLNPAIHRFVSLPCIPFSVDLTKAEDEYLAFHEHVDITEYIEAGFFDNDAYFKAVESGGDLHEFLYKAKFKSSVIGFGYDTSSNDFKVVRIWIPNQTIESYCESLLPTYEVYSYRAGIWRVYSAENLKSCGFYGKLAASKTGCFVNGTINWIIAASNQRRSVLMFDCESEEFRIVDLPVNVWYPDKTELMDYAGLLTLVMKSSRDYNSSTYVEFWVMEEHGDVSSWRKLYKFQDTRMGLKLLNLYEDKYMELAPYGPKQQQTKKGYNSYGSYDEILSGHVYKESLFLMDDAKAESYMDEDD